MTQGDIKGILQFFSPDGLCQVMAAKTAKNHYKEFGYYCPVHPEILKENPGTCKLCRMVLCEISTDDQKAISETSFNKWD